MKKTKRFIGTLTIAAFWIGTAAMCGEKEECFTCTDCSGTWAHMVNDNVYCSDGYDSKSDFRDFKEIYETDPGYNCTCTYTD